MALVRYYSRDEVAIALEIPYVRLDYAAEECGISDGRTSYRTLPKCFTIGEVFHLRYTQQTEELEQLGFNTLDLPLDIRHQVFESFHEVVYVDGLPTGIKTMCMDCAFYPFKEALGAWSPLSTNVYKIEVNLGKHTYEFRKWFAIHLRKAWYASQEKILMHYLHEGSPLKDVPVISSMLEHYTGRAKSDIKQAEGMDIWKHIEETSSCNVVTSKNVKEILCFGGTNIVDSEAINIPFTKK